MFYKDTCSLVSYMNIGVWIYVFIFVIENYRLDNARIKYIHVYIYHIIVLQPLQFYYHISIWTTDLKFVVNTDTETERHYPL